MSLHIFYRLQQTTHHILLWQSLSLAVSMSGVHTQAAVTARRFFITQLLKTNSYLSTTTSRSSNDNRNDDNKEGQGNNTNQIVKKNYVEESQVKRDVENEKMNSRTETPKSEVEKPSTEEQVNIEMECPTPPTNCCRSGCPTCVYLTYVEDLTKFYSNPTLTQEKIHKDIENIDDPSIKAWIIMELKGKGLW